MELWVRSQDKENLLKVDRLDVNGNKIQANFKAYSTGYDYLIIGIYESNDRALEVLDEIEEKISLLNTMSVICDTNSLISFKNAMGEDKIKGLAYPYQMPKE